MLSLSLIVSATALTASRAPAALSPTMRPQTPRLGAIPTVEAARHGRDADAFDDICDHLLVLNTDLSAPGRPFVCGTYRLIRRSVAEVHGGFYSADEYDLGALLNNPGELVELGRSCVHEDYRTGAVMQLLWRGIAEYLNAYDIKIMFGCGSLHHGAH